MKTTGTTAERKARALRVLSHGPWPVHFTWGLFHQRYYALGQVNAMRTLYALADARKVEQFTDETGCRNWRMVAR